MPIVFENQRRASPDQRREYVHYLARQRAPMIRALMLTATLAYGVAVLAASFLHPSPLPLWLRAAPLPPLILVTWVTRHAQQPRSLSTLAMLCVLLLEIGINLNNFGQPHGTIGVLPGLLLPVVSSVIWMGRTDFVLAMLLCMVGPLPMLLSGGATHTQVVQYLIYMVVAVGLSTVLRAFMERTLFDQFQLEQRLRERANTDDLTGLLLRNRFLELARLALDDIRHRNQPACMLYLDADHFKQLNDDYGHAAGDAALVELAAAMRSQLRRSDLIGRIGGEEFALLLPGIDLLQASGRAERLRLAARSIQRPDGPLTVSIGIVECRQGTETIEALLARADQAMRQAKRNGRDRIVGRYGR